MTLTASQLRALRWMDENPSTSAQWTVNGKPIRANHKPDDWNVMKIEGAQGSILIPAPDLKAIGPYVLHCTAPNKMYDITDEGRALLAERIAP